MIAHISAVAATVGFFGMICFQLLFALGFPLGQVAWGGKYIKLHPRLRVASLFSAVIFVFASIIVLEKAEVFLVFSSPTVVTYGVWIIAAFLGLNTISNFISRSKLEKRIMTPIALTLGLLCLIVAITSS